MHLTYDVNVVNAIGWLILVGGLVFRAGALVQKLQDFKEAFDKHCEEDQKQFQKVFEMLAERK